MQIVLKSDTITPDLEARAARMEHLRPAMQAIGFQMAEWAKDAFRNPSKRPAPWAKLKPATEKRKKGVGGILVHHGMLKRSPRVVSCDASSVTVASDRRAGSYSLAAIHQLGAPRARIPARPFFPFHSDGKAMPTFEAKCRKILERYLDKGKS